MKWYKGNKIYLRKLNNYLNLFGLNIKKTLSLINLVKYFKHYMLFRQLGGKVKNFYPMLDDFEDNAANIKNHLFHADLLTSQKVFKKNPIKHLDIGSRIDGVVAQIASFRKLDVCDIRDVDIKPHENINFINKDLFDINVSSEEEKYDSISSIGCVAHIGLGRYGDKIDPDGHKKGIKKLSDLSKTHSTIYTQAPVGKKGIEFNAHRIFDPNELIEEFEIYNFKLQEFHLINDEGSLTLNAKLKDAKELNFGGGYFVFIKE